MELFLCVNYTIVQKKTILCSFLNTKNNGASNYYKSRKKLQVLNFNLFREKEGNRTELKHNDLLKIIRDEFKEEMGMGMISHTPYIHPQNGQQYPMFELIIS